MWQPCSECGQPVAIWLDPVRNPNRRVGRDNVHRRLRDHDLCRRCWREVMAKARPYGQSTRPV